MAGIEVAILILLIPLVLGIILLVKSKPRGRNYPACGRCQYDLSASVGVTARCPECGAAFVEAGIIAPGGKRNATMVAVGLVLLLIPITCGGLLAMTATRAAQRRAVASQRAAVAAQAVLVQQQAASMAALEIDAARQRAATLAQQSPLLAAPVDPELVAKHRELIGDLPRDETVARLTDVVQRQSEALNSGTLDESAARQLRAEMQALFDQLDTLEN
jgi:hypothetical protein